MSPPPPLTVSLRCGTLRVEPHTAAMPLEELCGYASRRSRKRGFVFLSKVLGKHWPVRPRQMARTHELLASSLGPLDGPVVVVGMAETATALGQGVYEHLLAARPGDDAVFLHSTRYLLDHPVALRFDESHSHATDHLLYEPADGEARALFRAARTLVLVDDEISTGRTLARLGAALRARYPSLAQVHLVSLTDWLSPVQRAGLEEQLGLPVRHHSLLRGSFHLEPNASFDPGPIPDVTGKAERKDPILPARSERLGVRGRATLPDHALAVAGELPAGTRVLVLGTGEFSYLPFCLARHLEDQGHDVHYQSTTRSPLLTDGAITSVVETQDNYHDEIPNYVYNVSDRRYDHVLVCYETFPLPAGHRLCALLGARPLWPGPGRALAPADLAR